MAKKIHRVSDYVNVSTLRGDLCGNCKHTEGSRRKSDDVLFCKRVYVEVREEESCGEFELTNRLRHFAGDQK